MKKKDSKTTTRKAGKVRKETGRRFPAQKQRQQQSVIVKIDQSKRVVQRERQSKPQPIIQQPPPMNIMISPPPQLSISDAMRQQQPRFISQQDQQIRQPIVQTTTRPPQTLQENATIDGNSAIGKIVFTDFVEDTPILARDRLVGSDVPMIPVTQAHKNWQRLSAETLAAHNFQQSRKEGDELQDRGITRNTLLSSPNRFAALAKDDSSEPDIEDLPPQEGAAAAAANEELPTVLASNENQRINMVDELLKGNFKLSPFQIKRLNEIRASHSSKIPQYLIDLANKHGI